MTDREQARALVARTVEELGRLDIVVNNAGVMLLGPIVDAPTEEWDRMIALNVQGLLYVAHAALPHLLEAAAGDPRHVADLVNISSTAGRVASSGAGVYNLTKHGVGAFSESLRQEVTRRHVRVCLIEPGQVTTELTHHLRPEVRDILRQRIGESEPMEAGDIADAIAYVVTRPRRVAINEVLVRPDRAGALGHELAGHRPDGDAPRHDREEDERGEVQEVVRPGPSRTPHGARARRSDAAG